LMSSMNALASILLKHKKHRRKSLGDLFKTPNYA
jgi:hypothetical protein